MQDYLNDIMVKCISTQRLGNYQNNYHSTIEIYKWNIELSETLYPILHIVEVSLRNRLHDEIAEVLNDQEWLLNRNRALLEKLELHWLQKIDSYILSLRKKQKLDEGHLIAELSFGFWTTLLSGSFEHQDFLWPKLKNKVFSNTHGITIAQIRNRFDQIRRLRNRIFHYEAIWHKQDLARQHDHIIDAIQWIEPSLLDLIQIDRFKSIYARGPHVKK